ncbi:MAG: TerD family protein [Paraclostridium sp.]
MADMKVCLTKGETVNLSKTSGGKQLFKFGAGWDASSVEDTDIDVSAVIVGEDGKAMGADSLIYFRNLKSKCGGVTLSGDNRTGEGEGYDEEMIVDTSLLPSNAKRVVIIVSIFSGAPNFGLVKNLNIDAVDATSGNVLASFMPELEASTSKSIVIGEIVKGGNDFFFKASGTGYQNLEASLKEYGFSF